MTVNRAMGRISWDGWRLDAVGLVVQLGRDGGFPGPGEGRLSDLAWRWQEGGSGGLLTAHDGNSAKLEHAGRKQVNAGLMGISIAAIKQSCKQWKAVRAIL